MIGKFVRPMDKSILVHHGNLYKTKLIDNTTEPVAILDHIRIQPNMVIYNNMGLKTEAGMGNFQIFWDATHSTPLPDGVTFAIGDVITANFYPYKFVIRIVRNFYTEGTDKLHHIEMWAD